jgi:hypothetical protein
MFFLKSIKPRLNRRHRRFNRSHSAYLLAIELQLSSSADIIAPTTVGLTGAEDFAWKSFWNQNISKHATK